MRLGFALYKYFPYGGLQRDFFRIASLCLQHGHQVRVYCMDWQGGSPDGFTIVKVPERGLSSQAQYRFFSTWMQQDLQRNPVDLLIGFNKMPHLDIYYAADGCYEQRIRELHGWLYRLGGRYRHFSAYEKSVFAAQAGTEILMISAIQKPVFQRYYQTQDSRMHLLPPGIAKDRRAPENAAEVRAEFRREFKFGDEDLLLLMIGSGFKTKGLDRALLAMASLPDTLRGRTRLFALGQDKPDKFKKMAARLGLQQQLTMFKGRDDISRFLQGADVLIHPAHHENTGTVLLEAVVAGLPVLVSGICGYAHYVAEAGAGCVLERPFSQQECNQKLLMMLDPDKRRQWRASSLAWAESADIYDMPEHAVHKIEQIGQQNYAVVS